MNATINNTLAADARKAFTEAVALHARCEAEIAAGRFVYQGPSICGSEGDGVSSKVASDRALREEYGRAVDLLTRLLDRLVVEHTGFSGTFVDLVEAQRSNGYRPTFREKGDEAVAVLADAYDFVAGLWGLPETSYRPERQVAINPGQQVWTIFTDHVCEHIVKEVCEGCVRLKGRRSTWLREGEFFLDRRSASLALAAKFRQRASALLKVAEELESA